MREGAPFSCLAARESMCGSLCAGVYARAGVDRGSVNHEAEAFVMERGAIMLAHIVGAMVRAFLRVVGCASVPYKHVRLSFGLLLRVTHSRHLHVLVLVLVLFLSPPFSHAPLLSSGGRACEVVGCLRPTRDFVLRQKRHERHDA